MKAYGKCILAGEHSVVRGAPALVWPLRAYSLELNAEKIEGEIRVEGSLAEPFRESLACALASLGQELQGWKFSLASNIPPRAGLGSSAALAVALVKFLQRELSFPQDPFALALKIENIFHGQSSGLDITGVWNEAPTLFRRGRGALFWQPAWQPTLYLTDTGLRSPTKECVEKVRAAQRFDLDKKMEEAVAQIALALSLRSPQSLSQLASGLNQAGECFAEWDLVPPSVEEKIHQLRERGALAVKPTGSGNGGFLLSLWEKPVESADLIAVS